jgi:hypothetical protein
MLEDHCGGYAIMKHGFEHVTVYETCLKIPFHSVEEQVVSSWLPEG